jgi:uncharacterized protein
MTAVAEGRPGVARLLRRMAGWRVAIRWYVFALVGLPLTMVLATFIRPGASESFDISARPFFLDYLGAFNWMVLIGGPLFEEPGWTGFAQPRLQRLCGPLVAGLILGSLWALWHLPGFLIPSQDVTDIPPRGTVLDFVVFALALMGLRLIIVWVVNNNEEQRFDGDSGTCLLEHLLRRCPGSTLSFFHRARKLLESNDSRVRISVGAYCGYARPNGLSSGGRHSV